MTRALHGLAAVGLFVSGYEHYWLYRHGYHFIPIIGVLFLVNAAASAVTGLAVLVSTRALVRVGAIGVALGTLGAFAASRLLPNGIFNFKEHGFQPHQSVVTFEAEVAVIVTLLAAWVWSVRFSRGSPPAAPGDRKLAPHAAGPQRLPALGD
jgi:hypothetical protein